MFMRSWQVPWPGGRRRDGRVRLCRRNCGVSSVTGKGGSASAYGGGVSLETRCASLWPRGYSHLESCDNARERRTRTFPDAPEKVRADPRRGAVVNAAPCKPVPATSAVTRSL